MDTLYSWSARRAGAGITITHSCGKIAGVDRIEVSLVRAVTAVHRDGRMWQLFTGNR